VGQDDLLVAVLEDARKAGFLGPDPVARHVEHSRNLAAAIGPFDGRFVDLGAGGGVPGLVLATAWPGARGVLVDSQARRCRFLEAAVERLGLSDRVVVRCGRAEDLAREPELRESADLVVARAFGPPPVAAECAVGFLRHGGRLVVTEPPEGDATPSTRWPAEGLLELGLGPATPLRFGIAGAVVMVREGPLADRWPRRVGRPAKSPLW
jgi:16S rRNA (guanine527-N7)-methyltransferase